MQSYIYKLKWKKIYIYNLRLDETWKQGKCKLLKLMTVGFAAAVTAVDGSGIVRFKPLSFPPAWLSITLVLDGWWFRGSGRPILVVCNDVGWVW